MRLRQHLGDIYAAGVAAVHPSALIPQYISVEREWIRIGEITIPRNRSPRIFVAGAGKASGAMAVATESLLEDMISDGVVAVKHSPQTPLRYIRSIVAGHPAPDKNSVAAAEQVLRLARDVASEDIFIFLLSGGASSLLADLPDNCTLSELNSFNNTLVTSGASIHEINCVRKNVSRIKGGRLAAACSGTIVSLIISDVPDNDLSVIGSGPTVPDTTTPADALEVLNRYQLVNQTPASIMEYLQRKVAEVTGANRKKGSTGVVNSNIIIADIHRAIAGAKKRAEALGYNAVVLDELLCSDTEHAAQEFAEYLRHCQDKNVCVIAGGETTLAVRGNGMGGRNQHFALKALDALNGNTRISLLAAGTDGSDGPTDAAGAFVDTAAYEAAQQKGADPRHFLSAFDSYHFFKSTQSHFKPGPTDTNVMDLAIAIIE